ncbi:MAG: SCO family protein [Methylacidiphilales bacterium]|nr:SCO family protein [Candidatus Methylacidiphilales bacterium]
MPKVAASKKRKKERLPDSERMVLKIGLSLALGFALGLGLLMFSLIHYGRAPDPDAQTLIMAPDYPRYLIDFSLTDQSGHTITRKDLNGKVVVVSFLFTSCTVVCPYVNAQMEKIQRLTADQPDVKLLSLALDPVDDTVPVLANYGQNFGEDPNRWSFLTGDESIIRHLIGISFLPPDTTGEFSYMPGNFAHTQRIVLVDPKGHIVKYFDGLNLGAADAVVAEIKRLKESSE